MGRSLRLGIGLLAMVAVSAALDGCAVAPFDRAALGSKHPPYVEGKFGQSEGVTGWDGYFEEQAYWPTVIQLAHFAAPEPDGIIKWKLGFTGRVTHLIAFQTISVSVVYEGPLPAELLKGLRNTSPESGNEFLSDFVGFVQARVHESLRTKEWTDAAALRNDKYRGRFLGLLDVTEAALKGQGKAERSRFAVDVSGVAGAGLTLRYLGDDIYRIELWGGATLGPLPVL